MNLQEGDEDGDVLDEIIDRVTNKVNGLAFRGHDENEESSNRGNFLELLKWLAANSEEVNKYVLKNTPVLVAVAKGNDDCVWFFDQVSLLLSIIGVSCKRHGMLRNVRLQNILKALECGELETGSGLNQEMGAHLMLVILGYTNNLSQCLQRRDQDILNAMSLVNLAKSRMQQLRFDGWDAFLQRVTLFCNKHDIEVPAMEGNYVPYGRSTRFAPNQTNDDHFRREVYIGVIDQINQELDNRFDEVNMELLSCMSALNPANSFASFDVDKVRRLAEFYPNDISSTDLIRLEMQLDNYIDDMKRDDSFKGIDNLVQLSIKLVETKKHKVYDLVYLLLKLVLLLPVATASVERVFSAMSLVKSKLRNRMGDSLLDDCLVTFIERDIFFKVNEDDIIETFMTIRRRKTNKN
ncbi:uncharacterized protein LOC133890251 [Phragmites australis]|uniref:uncharacterized protein LOC133890251 n=1 Tax=Phragmites australis TaxID=29695 RepID=UPI002D78589E|nr:uncharacterized protein LOC133890251 [Phragmites australis]